MKKLYLSLSTALFVWSWQHSAAQAETLVLETAKTGQQISFRVNHPAHGATFTSGKVAFGAEVEGLLSGKPTVSAIDEIRIPLRSFNSGNANRDSNAMETMNAYKHPDLVFSPTDAVIKPVTSTTDRMDAQVILTGDLTLAGVTRPNQTITGWLHTDGKSWKAEGRFQVKCGEFNIERPSLLFIQIEDIIPIWFSVSGTVAPASPAPAVAK